jgi:hypothetical protein
MAECPTAQVLLENYFVAANEYFDAADKLSNCVGSHNEFEVAQQHAQQIHAQCGAALAALEKHRREHRCNIAI